MHERNLLFFPRGASKLDAAYRRDENFSATPLVNAGEVAHVVSSNDKNVTLETQGNQLFDQRTNRFASLAYQIEREDLHGRAVRLTTRAELSEGKSSDAYRRWREYQEKTLEKLQKQLKPQVVYVQVIPGETIPGTYVENTTVFEAPQEASVR